MRWTQLPGYAIIGIMMPEDLPLKPLLWMGSSRKDLRRFPSEVRAEMGYALFAAQLGGKHPDAKPLRGFGGASTLEIVQRHDGDSYRAVYTVQFEAFVYVLHAFQKKSKRGIATPLEEVERIRDRSRDARADYERRIEEGSK